MTKKITFKKRKDFNIKIQELDSKKVDYTVDMINMTIEIKGGLDNDFKHGN